MVALPGELPGLDPQWSTYLEVPSTAGVDPVGARHRWHYLDNLASLPERLGSLPERSGRNGMNDDGASAVKPTLLCVHGNPTWSYLWRSLLAAGADQGYRVVAVDQLDMGYSDRTGTFRRLQDRVTDLEDFVAATGISGPIITVGHDWGGVISLGFAHRNQERLAGVVLTNTAISHDAADRIPAPLRAALHPLVHRWGTQRSPAFLSITHALARPTLQPEVRRAFEEPYRGAERRSGIANFVADIPIGPAHPSHAALVEIAEGIRSIEVPTLMLWGPRDPIFSDRYLEDLVRRLPHASVHRFEKAGHLVQEDADVAGTLFQWLASAYGEDASATGAETEVKSATGAETVGKSRTEAGVAAAEDPDFTPMWHHLDMLASSDSASHIATADMGPDGKVARSLSWQELYAHVTGLAEALEELGVRRGSRVSLMVPPGVDLTVLIYACLRIGAVMVVADAGLGPRGLNRAVKGTTPEFLFGIERALLAARAFGWPGRKISVHTLPVPVRKLLNVETSLTALQHGAPGTHAAVGASPHADSDSSSSHADADAAILFTSGSTGPAKGVVYTHRQLTGMRDTVASTFGLKAGDGLVAGFAPFALLGPALGATSVTPDMDVTAPKTLRAQALADAAAAIDASVIFASPAALRNVLDTAADLTTDGRASLGKVSLLLSAGAPVAESLLSSLQELLPQASLHTPYGMTEALPVSDIDLAGIRAAALDAATGTVAGAGNGVCVGLPVNGARISVSALNATGRAVGALSNEPAVTGEILVSAPHVKDRYHRLWQTQQESARNPGWHRTGDVGHFDALGRLWVEGRLGHTLTTSDGITTPVGAEQALELLDGVAMASVVGVGPAGTQAAVAVVVTSPAVRKATLAGPELAAAARAAAAKAGISLAAVLTVPQLPTDIRHNAKIDRSRVAAWADRVLAGGPMVRL